MFISCLISPKSVHWRISPGSNASIDINRDEDDIVGDKDDDNNHT